ncbi:unnamed protein product [Lactuca virosa]|uniref:Uncharacterized protein n=1 Tax=Lactuca virosa TaxID=75947 RepID=A0AAU9MZ08_9ASTR|nr:unnamed protein product [Lactuca virosa]
MENLLPPMLLKSQKQRNLMMFNLNSNIGSLRNSYNVGIILNRAVGSFIEFIPDASEVLVGACNDPKLLKKLQIRKEDPRELKIEYKGDRREG